MGKVTNVDFHFAMRLPSVSLHKDLASDGG